MEQATENRQQRIKGDTELRESRYWLRLSAESNLVAPSTAGALVNEAGELVAILAASAKTARARS